MNYLFDSIQSMLFFLKLDETIPSRFEILIERDLATDDFTKLLEELVEFLVSPIKTKALYEKRGIRVHLLS